MRHGGLIAAGIAFSIATALADSRSPGDAVAAVGTRTIELHYSVEINVQPLRSVELWYTFDRGETWRLYGRDADLVPPMTFHAPQGGLCGIYFVITNAAGASGPPPSAETEPHLWVLVDETPPIVQFHRPQTIAHGGSRITARLRWAALAAGMPERPVDLAYRVLPDGAWRELATEIPNSGAYDWEVPAEVRGEVMFRVSVRDRAGRRSEAASEAVMITEAPSAAETETIAAPPRSPRVLSTGEMKRARELLRQGRRHQLHGAHDLAAARLRDALKIDPELPEALVGLGASLYALGEFTASAQAYELALRYTPDDRDALEGLAQTLVAQRNYEAAEARLLAIVQRQPQDTEIWLHLGDIAIYQGNEVTARDYYLKAATLAPEAISVVSRARARLDELPTLHRRYQQLETP